MKSIRDFLVNITLDSKQQEFLSILEEIAKNLSRGFFAKLLKSNKYKGIYLYGPVGRGKTLLISAFLKTLKIKNLTLHYQDFTKKLHQQIHKSEKSNIRNPIEYHANLYSKEYRVIFIDELEIRDVTDAFLVKRFVEFLLKKGVFVIFTTNITPQNIYKDGLQRQKILEFINIIEELFLVYKLDAEKDYRLSKICADRKTILYGSTSTNIEKFIEIRDALTKDQRYSSVELSVFGRKIKFESCFENVIYENIENLLTNEFSKNEYFEISNKFDSIIIDARNLNIESSDIAIKFINMIDNFYYNKILLVAIFDDIAENLYSTGKHLNEYKRTLSRLKEMESEEYITNSKYYKNEA